MSPVEPWVLPHADEEGSGEMIWRSQGRVLGKFETSKQRYGIGHWKWSLELRRKIQI